MEKVSNYLKEKYKSAIIKLEYIEKKYSKQYGWEYHIFFKKNGIHHKETMSQHSFMTL